MSHQTPNPEFCLSPAKEVSLSAFLVAIEAQATKNQLHRIELTVMEHNTRAFALYKKTGFETEGIKRDSLKINGHYVNEHYMALLI